MSVLLCRVSGHADVFLMGSEMIGDGGLLCPTVEHSAQSFQNLLRKEALFCRKVLRCPEQDGRVLCRSPPVIQPGFFWWYCRYKILRKLAFYDGRLILIKCRPLGLHLIQFSRRREFWDFSRKNRGRKSEIRTGSGSPDRLDRKKYDPTRQVR